MADNEHPDIKAALDQLAGLHDQHPETFGPNLAGQVSQTHLLDEAGRCTGWYAGYQTAMRDEAKKHTASATAEEVAALVAVVSRLVHRTPFTPDVGGIWAGLSFEQMDESKAALKPFEKEVGQ